MRKKRETPRRFDSEAFWMGVGVGVVCIGIGVLIVWATLTAPEGSSTQPGALSTTQRLVRMLPHTVQARLAVGFGGLMALFGVFTLVMGLWGSVKGLFPPRQPQPDPPASTAPRRRRSREKNGDTEA
jgi:hypothetical protein